MILNLQTPKVRNKSPESVIGPRLVHTVREKSTMLHFPQMGMISSSSPVRGSRVVTDTWEINHIQPSQQDNPVQAEPSESV